MKARRGVFLATSMAGAGIVFIALLVVQHAEDRRATSSGTPPSSTAPAFVFSEEAPASSTYWLADAENPSVRRRLGSVAHRPGWSGEAAIAPNGRMLAYTVLPANAANPDQSAELWVLPLDGGTARRLATAVDLRSFLIWSPDSRTVTFERAAGAAIQLWRQPLDGVAQMLASPPASDVVIPTGYGGEEKVLICARLQADEVDILSIDSAGTEKVLGHAGVSAARDFTVSPDGSQLAFLGMPEGSSIYAAVDVNLATGAVRSVGPPGQEEIGLAWNPDGTLSTGSAGAGAGVRRSGGQLQIPQRNHGLTQPLAWSPSGRFLAIRAFQGADPTNPGASQDLLVERGGRRRSITAAEPVRFIGWLPQ